MTTLLHPRSQGVIQEGTYVKTSEHDLQREALELERCLSLSLQQPHVNPIRFLGYDVQRNILTTKYESGESLFNTLWNQTAWMGIGGNSTRGQDLLIARIEELGQWLRGYHSSSISSGDRNPAISLLGTSFLAKVKALFDREVVDRRFLIHAEAFHEAIPDIMNQEGCAVLCIIHGDFISFNMLCDGSHNIRILDFGDTRLGFNLADVVRFWGQLWAIGQSSRWRASFCEKASHAFLSGYEWNESAISHEQYQVFRVYDAITNVLGFHCSKNYMGWRSRRINRKIAMGYLHWVKTQL